MNKSIDIRPPLKLFPDIRFHEDFPLPIWFAGLWFYLKSFLYVCYLYMLGLEPPPYEGKVLLEIIYFAIAFAPAFIVGLMLWNNRPWATWAALCFLPVDTILFSFHVMRLADEGYLSSGLTTVLEYGSLCLNILAFVWLVTYVAAKRTKQ